MTYTKPNLITDLASGLSKHIAEAARPKSPQAHLLSAGKSTQLFLPNGSRLISLNEEVEAKIKALLDKGEEKLLQQELQKLGLDIPPLIDDQPLSNPPLHALSLAIAQKCNMGCTYCYAEQGDFGGPSKSMPLDTALQAIDLLLQDRQKGDKAQLTFMGGEPLMNRWDLRIATEYAYKEAEKKGVKMGFSITTNGTLLKEEDAQFFEDYGFAVTLSLDGNKEAHDNLRPLRNGKGSFEQIMKRVRPLLKLQKKMQVAARVTVTPVNMNLAEVLDDFIEMGFHSVGFSPLLRSSNGKGEMSAQDLEQMLQAMIACGLQFEQKVMQGKRYPFLNMINAYKEIAKRTHRPYPCGAGAGYLGVSADGDLAACHRFVNDPVGKMGSVFDGVDATLQKDWLKERHVHQQSPCTQCWARYLCGGACHHEVIEKGRTACDYIRGWLYFTIQSYERMSRLAPEGFS